MLLTLLLAVPIAGNVLPCFTLPRCGAAATVALPRGFVRGLSGFGAFFVALTLGRGRAPGWAVHALAWAAARVVAVSLHGLSRRRLARTA